MEEDWRKAQNRWEETVLNEKLGRRRRGKLCKSPFPVAA